MGTSTMGSDLHSDKQDKILKLQARKKELETLLAAKNEELYKLCVQEVQFTGIMPPEAPLSPDVPQRERLGSMRSVGGNSAGDDVRDCSDNTSRRLRTAPNDRLHDSELNLRKNISHRLSTPSISGISTKSAPMRHVRRVPDTNSNYYPSPPQDRDTFSMHHSHTYPALPTLPPARQEGNLPDTGYADSQPNVYRHQTMTTEYMNKIYYTNTPSEAHKISRMRETHFSSSHPDIATHGATQPPVPPHINNNNNNMRSTPLLYQYASHLKAQSQHLGALGQHHHQLPPKRRAEGVRRNTLQRTQTYHLTSHSDYNQHLEKLADNYRPQSTYQHENHSDRIHVPNTLPLKERNIPRNLHMPLQVTTDDYKDRNHNDVLSPLSQMSAYSQDKFSPLSQGESKPKEKHWYETSLDSPTKPEAPLKKNTNLKRTSSVGNSQTYEIMMSMGRNTSLQSPNQTQVPLSPPVLSPSAVSLDSPTNLTVIEQGKCIPYREESKPFEMSDFYKYSTKFRQTNPPKPTIPASAYNKLPMELPQYAEQKQWHGY